MSLTVDPIHSGVASEWPVRYRRQGTGPLARSAESRPARPVRALRGWRWTAVIALASVLLGLPKVLERVQFPSRGYVVVRRDMPLAVTERGSLESQENVRIVCEVDDIHGDAIDGTPVLWMVPNGATVSKGDLLVELDSASHRERLDSQILAAQQARSQQIQAQSRYENQITLNQTATADAQLAVRLAELELQMFSDEQSGTHKLEVEQIQRGIDDVNNEILDAQATLELKRNTKAGIECLFKMGYAGKSELDRIRLDYLQAENLYATRLNQLRTQLAALQRKQTYEHQMRLLRLEGNLQSAERNLEQVQLNDKARLAQAKAAVDAADQALAKQDERLARYREQINKCKIFAPQDGLVVYARSADPSLRGAKSA